MKLFLLPFVGPGELVIHDLLLFQSCTVTIISLCFILSYPIKSFTGGKPRVYEDLGVVDHSIYCWLCAHPLQECSRGRFKNTYELLNLRALKISKLHKNHIFQCMGKIFCVEFQRVPLKFHTKYLTHTLKDVDFIHIWNLRALWFKSS